MMAKKCAVKTGLATALLVGSSFNAWAAVWTWEHNSGDNDFNNTANWISETGVYEFPAGETMVIERSGADQPVLSTGSTPNMDGLRIGYASGSFGEFEQTGGTLNMTGMSGRETVVGHEGGTGVWTMSGGEATLNNLSIGASGNGTFSISGGEMDIINSRSGGSMLIGAENNSGDGTVNLSGGILTTASGILLGNNSGAYSTFHVNGAGLLNNGSATSDSSGFWQQDGRSTLKATIDSANGFSLGQIVLFDGSGDNPSVIFESGASLDVAFSGADLGEANQSWDLMSWPSSTSVSDNGLAFSANVDLEKWSFEITDTALRITYGVGSEEEPPQSANGMNFVHPGLSHKISDLDRMKAMVEAQIDPWYTSYQTLAAESKASYNYTVQGDTSMKVLYRDSPKTNLSAFESDSRAAYYNALRWYIEGDSRYADKAVEIFNAWTGLEYLQHSGTRALTSSLIYQMLEAAEIIRGTYDGWEKSDIQAFKDMLVYPGYSNTAAPDNLMVSYEDGGRATWYWRAYMFDYVRAGNQEASAMRACMALGIFLDNEIIYDRALRYAKGLPHRDDDLPYASGPHTTGSVSSENDYQISYNYTIGYDIEDYGFEGVLTNYIWETGQAAESSRDPWHTWWGMHLLACLGEMSWSQGDDLWSEADSRILLGMEYHNKWSVSYLYPYPDQPTEWTPTAASGEFLQQFTRTGRTFTLAINPYYGSDTSRFYRTRYNEVAMWEHALGHYYGRGLKTADEVKWTIRARDTSIERNGTYETKPSNGNGSYLGYGGLTCRRPDYCYGEPVSGFDTNGLPVYALNKLPCIIEAENYDQTTGSGEGRTYHDLTSTNAGAVYRSDAVDIAAHAGGYAVTDLEAGEWLSYTVHVPETRDYRLAIRYAGEGATVRFAFGGSDVTGDVELPSTGSRTNWRTFAVGEMIPLTQGVQNMRIYVAGGDFELDRIVISEDVGEVPETVVIDSVSVDDDGSGAPEIALSVANSETRLSYLVKSTDSLTEPDWQTAGELVDGTGGDLMLSVPVTEPQSYYKLEAWYE